MTTAATETPTNEQTAPAAAAKVGLTSILVPVLLSTVITLGAVGGGVMWLLKSGKLGGGAAASAPEIKIVEAPPASHVVALEPMIVNLSDAGGRSYLRAAVSLRIKDEEKKAEKKEEAPKDPKAVDGVATALRDTTLTVLSRESADSLLAPDGRETLKKTLEHEYHERNSETKVLEVYFTDFLVQRG